MPRIRPGLGHTVQQTLLPRIWLEVDKMDKINELQLTLCHCACEQPSYSLS